MSTNHDPEWEPRAAAREILQSQRVAVTATSHADQPWAATVFYADDGFTLYVNTPDDTTMLRNMLRNPRVSYAIDERRPTFFLQGLGHAAVVDNPVEFERAKQLLSIKVPEARVGKDGYTLVKIVTERIFVSDFRVGRRPRAELDVAEDARNAPDAGDQSSRDSGQEE